MKTLSIIITLLLVNMFLGCSESPDPRIGEPYYDTLDELENEYSNWWNPYRPQPGNNVATFIFHEEPLNLRVLNVSPNETTEIIGWKLEKTKGWWKNEYRDMFVLEIEYYCETYFKFLIRHGVEGSYKPAGSYGIGSPCHVFEY